MKLHSFQELTTRIINLSTRDKKPISITFSGTDAYTNTKTVNIPTLPSGTILSQSQLSIWLGYVIHEGPGHQSHTDLYLYADACEKRNNKQFSYILNLLEDIRIENKDISLYPGDRKYLDSVHHFVDNKIPPHMAQNPDIMGLIYKHLFIHHRNLDTNIIKGNLDQETAKLISQIDLCTSTQDCITLANKIINYLNQKKQEENQKGNENSKESNNGNDTKNNGSTNASNDGGDDINDGNNNGIGDKNVEDPAPLGGGVTQNPSQNHERSEGASASERVPTSSSQNQNRNQKSFSFSDSSTDLWQEITEIKNIIQSLKDQNLDEKENNQDLSDLNGKSIFPPENISYDRIYVPSHENMERYTSTRIQCSSQILSLKKMFRIYLQAQTKKSQLRGLEEGKLDTQRLHIVATGAKTIFKDQNLKLLPETAIELMIDMSGSMDAKIARTSAIILSEALSSIPQIKLSISGFTTNSFYRRSYERLNPNSGRQDGLDILLFKDYSTPYQKSRAKLGAITNTGFTPLVDAYGKSLEHIIPRSETRKIIFLITDGVPEFTHGANHSDFLLMEKIHKTCQRYKIQTLGLGIENNGNNLEFLSKYFDKSINITKTQDLPKNLLEGLKFFI